MNNNNKIIFYRKNYSLRSKKTTGRVSTHQSMVSSNVVQKERSETHIDRTNEVQREILSSHHNDEENRRGTRRRSRRAFESTYYCLSKTFQSSFHFWTHDVLGCILGEIIDSFIIKRSKYLPQIPLCRLMENEVICAVGLGPEGLIARFAKFGYSVFGAPFIVGFKKPEHDQH